ncbi:hypothetical protein DT23_17220 [Thioclava indica]|uniref:Sulfotransferase domain-containing protein n=2 Tax=Thioclava indica TaxID=1353528 RepID=A0A074JKY6_9RHOB|nr:hypothetical protein DT23_17220 [Thioclava indica]
MLSDALELPFRRNTPFRFESAVTHGHFLNPLGLTNVVVIWRDPRDLLVSFYYHCYFINEHQNADLVAMMKAKKPFKHYEDIRANLPAFIRFLTKKPVSPDFTWVQFAQMWNGRPGVVQTSYEALRTDTAGELRRVAKALTGRPLPPMRAAQVVETHTFARAKAAAEDKRPKSVEKSFIREGALGVWRKHFTPEAEAALDAGGYTVPMARLGYVPEGAARP